MEPGPIIIVLLGALAGGFVAGLAGFGTGLTALGIWLYVLEPAVAATLVIVCSVVSQVQTLPSIWHQIEARRVLPFIVPGLLGVPIGTVAVSSLDAQLLKIGVGCILLAFSAQMLAQTSRRAIAWGGSALDGLIGFGGGLLGGLAGLSGALPTMWAAFRGWPKGESRGLFQAFNLSILSTALITHAFAGLLNAKVAAAVVAALPGTMIGSWLGSKAFARLSDRQFRQLILFLLCLSGGLLIWTNI